MNKPLVVFSAASMQAFAVAQTAIDQGCKFRAIVRAGKASTLLGAHEIVRADLKDTESLANAMFGASAAFFHLPMPAGPGESDMHLANFFAGEKKATLPLLIFSSSSFADNSFSPTPLIDGNRQAVDQVLKSGIPAIVLKPGLYLENLQVPFFVPNFANGILVYPPMKADQALSWTSHLDQALLAVAALKKPELIGGAYNIASLQAVTPIDLANILGKQRGNLQLQFKAISTEQFAAPVGAALNNPSLNFLPTDLYRSINQQSAENLIVDTDSLQKTFDVELKSVSERLGGWL
jgi:uncharacterized protein YbjT (DUF2867 family)